MSMDYQILFNVFFAIAGTLSGFILNNLWQAMKDLQRADTALVDKVGAIEVLVAGQYVKRDTFDAKVDALFSKLDQMDNKFESKLDRVLAHSFGNGIKAQ